MVKSDFNWIGASEHSCGCDSPFKWIQPSKAACGCGGSERASGTSATVREGRQLFDVPAPVRRTRSENPVAFEAMAANRPGPDTAIQMGMPMADAVGKTAYRPRVRVLGRSMVGSQGSGSPEGSGSPKGPGSSEGPDNPCKPTGHPKCQAGASFEFVQFIWFTGYAINGTCHNKRSRRGGYLNFGPNDGDTVKVVGCGQKKKKWKIEFFNSPHCKFVPGVNWDYKLTREVEGECKPCPELDAKTKTCPDCPAEVTISQEQWEGGTQANVLAAGSTVVKFTKIEVKGDCDLDIGIGAAIEN